MNYCRHLGREDDIEPEELVIKKEKDDIIENVLNSLDGESETILRLRFGFYSNMYNLKELSRILAYH